MKPFTHLAMPGRVVHGAGRVSELADEIATLGAERVMFCCTESRVPEVEILAATLGDRLAGICDAAKKVNIPNAAVIADLPDSILGKPVSGLVIGLVPSDFNPKPTDGDITQVPL